MMENDIYIFTEANLLAQVAAAPYTSGYYKVQFYAIDGRPVAEKNGQIEDFYLYPSGGTLRNSQFNIVNYSTRFDVYKGFRLPDPVSASVRTGEMRK